MGEESNQSSGIIPPGPTEFSTTTKTSFIQHTVAGEGNTYRSFNKSLRAGEVYNRVRPDALDSTISAPLPKPVDGFAGIFPDRHRPIPEAYDPTAKMSVTGAAFGYASREDREQESATRDIRPVVGRSGPRVEKGPQSSGMIGEVFVAEGDIKRRTDVQRVWLGYTDPAIKAYRSNGGGPVQPIEVPEASLRVSAVELDDVFMSWGLRSTLAIIRLTSFHMTILVIVSLSSNPLKQIGEAQVHDVNKRHNRTRQVPDGIYMD